MVLSACETALGKEKQGVKESNAEGFIGLTRGFLYAGTPTVVVSLWKVDDEATAGLMKEFYKQLAGLRVGGLVNGKQRQLTNSLTHQLDKAEALRRAQLKMLRGKDYPLPPYWAAFVAVGDWR